MVSHLPSMENNTNITCPSLSPPPSHIQMLSFAMKIYGSRSQFCFLQLFPLFETPYPSCIRLHSCKKKTESNRQILHHYQNEINEHRKCPEGPGVVVHTYNPSFVRCIGKGQKFQAVLGKGKTLLEKITFCEVLRSNSNRTKRKRDPQKNAQHIISAH